MKTIRENKYVKWFLVIFSAFLIALASITTLCTFYLCDNNLLNVGKEDAIAAIYEEMTDNYYADIISDLVCSPEATDSGAVENYFPDIAYEVEDMDGNQIYHTTNLSEETAYTKEYHVAEARYTFYDSYLWEKCINALLAAIEEKDAKDLPRLYTEEEKEYYDYNFIYLKENCYVTSVSFCEWVNNQSALLEDGCHLDYEENFSRTAGPWNLKLSILQSIMDNGNETFTSSDFAFKLRLLDFGMLIPIVCCISWITFLVVMVLLTIGFGRSHGMESVHLYQIDHIPFELFLAADIAIVSCFAAIGLEVGSKMKTPYLIIGIGSCMVSWIIGLFGFRTLVVRLKDRCLFRTSLLGSIHQWARRMFNRETRQKIYAWARMIPDLKRYILYFIGICVIDFACTALCHNLRLPILMLMIWVAERILLFLLLLNFVSDFTGFRKKTDSIAAGNIAEVSAPVKYRTAAFSELSESLAHIQDGLGEAVEKQLKSERMKTELITNISHDIKTPLTSIINYVDLLEHTDVSEEQAAQYLQVLSRQSTKLKKLISDLIEASKASTGNLEVNLVETDLGIFINQVTAEYQERMKSNDLELITRIPEQSIRLLADGRHLWRVFDNLLGNAVKYALPNTRVYIDVEPAVDHTSVIIRNISKTPLTTAGNELVERFTRGDESRHTEGSGLGLAIAYGLMEAQGGKLEIICDGDLFKAVITLRNC